LPDEKLINGYYKRVDPLLMSNPFPIGAKNGQE
jgi:hypothetical protein